MNDDLWRDAFRKMVRAGWAVTFKGEDDPIVYCRVVRRGVDIWVGDTSLDRAIVQAADLCAAWDGEIPHFEIDLDLPHLKLPVEEQK